MSLLIPVIARQQKLLKDGSVFLPALVLTAWVCQIVHFQQDEAVLGIGWRLLSQKIWLLRLYGLFSLYRCTESLIQERSFGSSWLTVKLSYQTHACMKIWTVLSQRSWCISFTNLCFRGGVVMDHIHIYCISIKCPASDFHINSVILWNVRCHLCQ